MVAVQGVPLERVTVPLGCLEVRLWRATQLERFVDGAALLRAEAPPEPPYWMHLWPGAVALARRLASAELRGARVLELGCGLGLPALAAARRGARVVASDRERAPLLVLARSAADNGCALACVQTDWRAAGLRGGFDLCLGADIGYDRDGAEALAAALASQMRGGGAVWLADSVNVLDGGLAAALRAVGLAVDVETWHEHEDGRPVTVRGLVARRA